MSKDALPHTATGGEDGAEVADAGRGREGGGTGHCEHREAAGEEDDGGGVAEESSCPARVFASGGAYVHGEYSAAAACILKWVVQSATESSGVVRVLRVGRFRVVTLSFINVGHCPYRPCSDVAGRAAA